MSAVLPVPESFLLGELRGWVSTVAQDLAGTCLVESQDGHLLAHAVAVPDVPAVVVEAIIHSDLTRLERAVTHNRTVGLTGGGPVIAGDLSAESFAVVRVALRQRDMPVGSLWLVLTDGAIPTTSELDYLGAEAASLLTSQQSAAAELMRILDGDISALPQRLQGCRQLCVVVAEGLPPSMLAGLSEWVVTAQVGPLCYAVLGEKDRLAPSTVARAMGPLLARRRGGRAAVSDPCGAAELFAARTQAEHVLAVTDTGTCATAAGSRERIVMRHLAQSFQTLPPLGHDPLTALRAYDERRHGHLVESLRAWLTHGAELAPAARSLGVHRNTLGYRLVRASQVAKVDFATNAAARFELWLRLVASG